jgi:hypothetical protein
MYDFSTSFVLYIWIYGNKNDDDDDDDDVCFKTVELTV